MPVTPMSELMARYCGGDAGAFRELYGQIRPGLFGYLARMSRDHALAHDVLQLTFMKLHRARGAFVVGADPVPWIYAIAHRTFLDEARRRVRDQARFVGDDEPHDEPTATPEDSALAPYDPVLVATALDALATLPAHARQAIVLTKLEGKSLSVAAEIAGTTVGAMKARVHRGYVALRRALAAVESPEWGQPLDRHPAIHRQAVPGDVAGGR